ncbi:DUF2158 domain-containing protein [Acinetobacter sp.]|uniref:DUF2158 domain-containing protein n=1 Tax=Acinetobacter sp. TaxID=472 RepID=UPI00388F0514
MINLFKKGDAVQLRSGGPLMTVSNEDADGFVHVIYYNGMSGKIEQFFTTQESLKSANTTPEVPLTNRPRSSMS